MYGLADKSHTGEFYLVTIYFFSLHTNETLEKST